MGRNCVAVLVSKVFVILFIPLLELQYSNIMLLILTHGIFGLDVRYIGSLGPNMTARGPGNLPASRGSATVDDIKPALP